MLHEIVGAVQGATRLSEFAPAMELCDRKRRQSSASQRTGNQSPLRADRERFRKIKFKLGIHGCPEPRPPPAFGNVFRAFSEPPLEELYSASCGYRRGLRRFGQSVERLNQSWFPTPAVAGRFSRLSLERQATARFRNRAIAKFPRIALKAGNAPRNVPRALPARFWRPLPMRLSIPRLARFLPRPFLPVLCVLILGVSIPVYLWDRGALRWPERTWQLQDIRAEQGIAFTAKYPAVWPGFALDYRTAVVTEDGRALARAKHESIVRENGGGTFFPRTSRAIFAADDGSDPRSNGRTYRLTSQLQVFPQIRIALWALSAASIAFLLWSGGAALIRWTAGGAAIAPAGGSPVFWACAIFAAAFAVRVHFVWKNPFYTDGIFAIRGSPYSDAWAWSKMAGTMAAGGGVDAGFPAKRPLFPMLLALFYTWTGISVPVAKAVQAMLGGLTSAFVFLIFRRLGGHWAALAAALFFAIDPQQVAQTAQLMTEPLGILCIALSAWLLMLAGPRLAPWPLFWAGVALALSNLARPLTLFGFPFYALLIGAQTFRNGARTLRALAVPAGVFTLGVAICIGPWIVRQHAVHGIWSISDNSASGLFAASTPEYGAWTMEVESLPEKAGIPRGVKNRYDFYQRGFRENLAKHPGYYRRHVLEGLLPAAAGGAIVSAHFRAAGWLAFGVVALLGLWRRVWLPPIAAAISCLLLSFLTASAAHWVALAGFAWMLWRKPFPALAVGVTFLSAILGSALFGNAVLFRMRYLIDWIEAGWVLVALLEFSRMAAGLVMRIPRGAWTRADEMEEEMPAHPVLGKMLRRAGWLAAAFLLVSSARLVALNVFFPAKPEQQIVLAPEVRRRAMALLAERVPEWQPLVAHLENPAPIAGVPPLEVRTGWLGCHTYSFPANLDIHHADPIFGPRPYPRSVVEVFKGGRAFGRRLAMATLPGELPSALLDGPCTFAGFFVDISLTGKKGFQTVEILAVIPGCEITPEAIRRAVLAPPIPETKAWIEAIKANRSSQ